MQPLQSCARVSAWPILVNILLCVFHSFSMFQNISVIFDIFSKLFLFLQKSTHHAQNHTLRKYGGVKLNWAKLELKNAQLELLEMPNDIATLDAAGKRQTSVLVHRWNFLPLIGR